MRKKCRFAGDHGRALRLGSLAIYMQHLELLQTVGEAILEMCVCWLLCPFPFTLLQLLNDNDSFI